MAVAVSALGVSAFASCVVPVSGCTNSIATNYNPTATVDDGSCVLPVHKHAHHTIVTVTTINGVTTVTMGGTITTSSNAVVGSENSTYSGN